ncbi:major centromere autoantigen B-like [Penaeus japonicus]|uniref:major centromere autoantigen B-like n=1 Tax=Penaeus japonicus TaxID=27405 RepID=UPI001C710491|nr:major centromere autoantigen B-like [Penaeus japonicus]
MSRKPFKQLTLAEKVALIKESDGRTQGKLAEKYSVSRTTVRNVLKRKADLNQAYEDNEPANKKRSNSCRFEAVNEFVWEWFCRMRAANVPISGPMTKEKALEYAASQGIDEFKGSTGCV